MKTKYISQISIALFIVMSLFSCTSTKKIAEGFANLVKNNADAWNNLSAEDVAKIQKIGQKAVEATQEIFDGK